jgi:uncharacterized protein (TIGR02266 family)
MTNEQRQHPRVPVEMFVEESQGGARYFQRTGNLSAGGLFLEGTFTHPRGTHVELRFTLPGEREQVSVRGEIVGEPDPGRLGMHVRFIGLDEQPDLRDRLAAFVDGRSSR